MILFKFFLEKVYWSRIHIKLYLFNSKNRRQTLRKYTFLPFFKYKYSPTHYQNKKEKLNWERIIHNWPNYLYLNDFLLLFLLYSFAAFWTACLLFLPGLEFLFYFQISFWFKFVLSKYPLYIIFILIGMCSSIWKATHGKAIEGSKWKVSSRIEKFCVHSQFLIIIRL